MMCVCVCVFYLDPAGWIHSEGVMVNKLTTWTMHLTAAEMVMRVGGIPSGKQEPVQKPKEDPFCDHWHSQELQVAICD